MEEGLTSDLMTLQSQLESMLGSVHANSSTLQRFQVFEKELLKHESLVEMLDYILTAQDLFNLDYIGLCLIDAKGELEYFLQEGGFDLLSKPQLIILPDDKLLQATFGLSSRPYVGSYKTAKCADFFAYDKRKPASIAIIPLLRRGKYLGTLNMGSIDPQQFEDSMATDYIEYMSAVVGVCLENQLNFEALTRNSMVDSLTGVNNRHFLEQRLDDEIIRAHSATGPLSCFYLGIDGFQQLNDEYGRAVADQVLIAVAAVFRAQLDNNDILVRYTGEIFIVLLANTDQGQAQEIAQSIRQTVKEIQFSAAEFLVTLTISIGIAIYKTSGST